MNPSTFDMILILANPLIILFQCFFYTRTINNYTKMLRDEQRSSMHIFKEYMEYRFKVNLGLSDAQT